VPAVLTQLGFTMRWWCGPPLGLQSQISGQCEYPIRQGIDLHGIDLHCIQCLRFSLKGWQKIAGGKRSAATGRDQKCDSTPNRCGRNMHHWPPTHPATRRIARVRGSVVRFGQQSRCSPRRASSGKTSAGCMASNNFISQVQVNSLKCGTMADCYWKTLNAVTSCRNAPDGNYTAGPLVLIPRQCD